MTDKRKYDSTVARIAGNIAGSLVVRHLHLTDVAGRMSLDTDALALESVAVARAIVAEVERTEPVSSSPASADAPKETKP